MAPNSTEPAVRHGGAGGQCPDPGSGIPSSHPSSSEPHQLKGSLEDNAVGSLFIFNHRAWPKVVKPFLIRASSELKAYRGEVRRGREKALPPILAPCPVEHSF